MAPISKIMVAATSRSKQLWAITAVPVLIAVLCLLYCYDPSAHHFYPPCIIKRLTGLNCPGCGSTRACHQLLHGHVYAAMNYNILMMLFLPVMAWRLFVQLTGRGLHTWNKIIRPLPVLIIISLFWILRNIDMYPLTWLNADK